MPSRARCSISTIIMPEDDHFEIARGTEDLRQQVLQPLFEDGDDTCTDQRPPDVCGAADHRHEQVFDADVQTERRRIDEALHVGIEPAGERCEESSNEKDDDLRPCRIHSHGFGHDGAAFEGTDGAALARIEEVPGDPDRASSITQMT